MIEVEPIKRPNYDFPTIDFKFRNSGDTVAFVWQFTVHIQEATVDLTPELQMSLRPDGQDLVVIARNNGWGPARNLQATLSEPTLNELFEHDLRHFSGTIASAEAKEI